ncbi:hypothetical protein ACSSV4_002924 [Roseovarius sp. MBR-154]|jgi:hypothetical protein
MLQRKWQEMPRIVRFMIDQFMNGAVMGCAFGLVLVQTDTAGLARLLEGLPGAGPTALFLAQGALIFGALGMAVGVMSLGTERD